MRVNIVGQGGYSSAGLSINGATLTGPLTLVGNPVAPLEAATKQYVDLVGNSLDASKITTGTLAVGRMPAFTGDLSSASGNNVLTLSNTGVTAGTYTKVTVDAKGRVTGTGNITLADIPNLDWSKITSGKPTTLSGYGITNGVSVNGDTVTGYVTAHADPTSGLQLATKQYVDNKTATGGVIPAGTTIRRTSVTTPAGYLRCNGGLVSKTAYPALYAIFGDNAVSQYGVGPGAGQPWRQQYEFNTTQTTDITGWGSVTSLPGTLADSQVVVTKNRVYLLGGYNGSTYVATVYTAPVNADGTLGGWSTGTSLPGILVKSQAIVTKNRVYLLGGSNGNGVVSTVYTAPINADGTLGTWTTGTSIPVGLQNSSPVCTINRVYLLGGYSAGSISTIYTAPINADGTLGAWSTASNLPTALTNSTPIVTKNRVYLLGGDGPRATVYTAAINADGTLGSWTTAGPLPVAATWPRSVVTKNRAYLFGGYGDSGVNSSVCTAPVNADGTLGTWTLGTNMPSALVYSQVFTTSSRVYIASGYNGSSYIPSVYAAPFSGGLNDYSTFYTTGYTATDPDNFQLPDTTTSDTGGLYTYIKT